jgi:hypothetical protein
VQYLPITLLNTLNCFVSMPQNKTQTALGFKKNLHEIEIISASPRRPDGDTCYFRSEFERESEASAEKASEPNQSLQRTHVTPTPRATVRAASLTSSVSQDEKT